MSLPTPELLLNVKEAAVRVWPHGGKVEIKTDKGFDLYFILVEDGKLVVKDNHQMDVLRHENYIKELNGQKN